MTAAMPPRWARAADAAAVAAFLLSVFVLLFGGFVLHAGPARISVHSADRLLFIAVALVAIRHAAHPSDPLHRRLLRGMRARTDASAAAIVPPAIAGRVAVLLVGYVAVITLGLASTSVGFQVSARPMVNLPARFDAGWYASIALEGYIFEGRWNKQQNLAFFPAFPMLERAIGYPFGAFAPAIPRETRMARLLWGGVTISLIAFAWAALYLWRLARDTIGEARAADAVWLLAAYPFAVFYSAPYNESLFLLGSVAAVYHFRRQELLPAAAWGALVGFTRPNGCFLSLVLALLMFEAHWKSGNREIGESGNRIGESGNGGVGKSILLKLVSASAPGVALLIFSTFVYHRSGDFFGWARLHEAWGRSYEGLAPVTRAYGWLSDEGLLHVVENIPYDTLNSLGLIFALLMLWPVARRLGFAFAAFILINVVPPMLAGGVLSMGRLTATLFPVFLALAASISPRAVTPLVTAFAIAQGFAAILFFTWRPLF